MKNKIQKNNEKILDHSTRSRSIKSTWTVRLLVLLVMLTTILASFVVPVSAAENPFVGANRVSIDHFILMESYTSNGFLNGTLNNGFVSGSVIPGNPNVTVSVSNNKFDINYPSTNMRLTFKFSNAIPVDEYPFESCNLPIRLSSSYIIPANTNIVQYAIDHDLVQNGYLPGLFSEIRFLVPAYVSNEDWLAAGDHVIFTLRDGAYTTEIDGGIRSVFDLIGSWLSNTFNTLGGVFFDNGSFTVLGGLAIGSLGVSVILLLIKVISNFIRFRG